MGNEMKLTKNFLLLVTLLMSTSLFARGGDDVGNGGFAYKQSVRILKMATASLEDKIRDSYLKDLVDHPERRAILQDTLGYEDLDKLSKKNHYRGGRKLAMNYIVNPPTVIVLKSYFEAFMGRTDSELEEASLEVQKRLLHEASHIWGYKEEESEKFAIAFLEAPGNVRHSDITIDQGSVCSCLNGKSDIINNCASFCAIKPKTSQPTLYVNAILGEATANNPLLGSLYKWCNVQLSNDETSPQCSLVATDGENEVTLPVTISPRTSNSFSANIISLEKNRTWILKLVETKTGSEAQSKEFQIIRSNPIDENIRKINVMPVNQYTCMNYGGKQDPGGAIYRTGFVRLYYYFQAIETPAPVPPAGGNRQSMVVCHDEQLRPGHDSAEYERLERIVDHVNLWDLSDMYFKHVPAAGKLMINKILDDRLADEYGIVGSDLNLFKSLSFLSRPNFQSTLGYVLTPFTNTGTGKSFCPTADEYNRDIPLFNLLSEYMGDTEALYVAESEAETVMNGNDYKTFYATMLVSETIINQYGFYIENGLKIKATELAKNTKTIYYYWPISASQDPMNKGSRRLFTLRTPSSLNGSAPSGVDSSYSSDKRIGCIPKGAEF